jgi:hypothetical protein
MNKARRQELYDVTSFLDDAIDRLEEIKGDEEEAFNSMPEGFQNSSCGDKMQGAVGMLDGFIEKIENIKTEMGTMIVENK